MVVQYNDGSASTWSIALRSGLLVALLLLLASCGSRPEFGALALTDVPAQGAKSHNIMIVTTRERDARRGHLFQR